jgi:ADP-ribose pyrophosphatase YjhB (NUDIX family)
MSGVLARLPRPFHRALLWLAHRARLAWWALRRPELHGCNAIVRNARGEVLLVRHSYQEPGAWMLPGGGMRRGESAERAAERELAEETGCELLDARELDIETVPLAGARNHSHLVLASTRDAPRPDGREILAAAFFSHDALPATTAAAARRRIARAQNSES